MTAVRSYLDLDDVERLVLGDVLEALWPGQKTVDDFLGDRLACGTVPARTSILCRAVVAAVRSTQLRRGGPVDLEAVEAEFLQQCGPCDYGIAGACNCPERDYRSTMLDLVLEVRRLRGAYEAVVEGPAA